MELLVEEKDKQEFSILLKKGEHHLQGQGDHLEEKVERALSAEFEGGQGGGISIWEITQTS